jgi:hypothetical protein
LEGHIYGTRHITASPFRIKSCLGLEVPRKRELKNKLVSAGYYLRDHPELLIATAIVAVGFIVAAIMLSVDPNFLKFYGDGVSHLVIARRVFDNLTPGLAQLGGVWLPMTHLALMPFVGIDFLFHTGLAGTIVSISATAVSAVALFRILRLQFASPVVGIFGSILYFANPSVIYMGISPMMEALFMMFFILSVYYIQKWYYLYISEQNIRSQYRTILKCGLAVSAASLTRYEGWVLPLGLIAIILFTELFIRRRRWRGREKLRLQALLSIALLFGFMGITLWMAWNVVIFKDPLYSLTGPYSASVQADSRDFNHYFRLNPVVSSSVIFKVAEEMYGLHVLAISSLGIGVYLYTGAKRKRVMFHLLTVLMLMAPILADFMAMLEGSGEIAPQGSGWFNGRYLIFIAPLLAFGSASLLNSAIEIRSRWKPVMSIITVLLIAGSYAFTFTLQPFEYGKVVALDDGTTLSSGKVDHPEFETGKQLGRLYQGGNIVLFTLSQGRQLIMLESHIPLKNYIDLANQHYWEVSIVSPWTYAEYVVLRTDKETTYDPLIEVVDYWIDHQQTLHEHYNLIYENGGFAIFKRK